METTVINKFVAELNQESFLPLIKSKNLPVGIWIVVRNGELRETEYGQRLALELIIDGGISVLFLPPSYVTNPKRRENTLCLFRQKSHKVFIRVKNQTVHAKGNIINLYEWKVEETRAVQKSQRPCKRVKLATVEVEEDVESSDEESQRI